MTDIIFEQTIKHTTNPISSYPNYPNSRTFRFGLHIKVEAVKHHGRVRRVAEKYSMYYIFINQETYCQDGSVNYKQPYWPQLNSSGDTHSIQIHLDTTNILSKEVLDYLSSIQLKDEDLYNPYMYILKQTLQTKIDLCPPSTCVEHANSLCEEFETLHKKNDELQQQLTSLKLPLHDLTQPKNYDIELQKIQKENTELHQTVKLLQQNHTELYQLVKLLQKDRETDQLEVQKIQKDNAELRQLVTLLQKDKVFEQLPLLKVEEKIRCLEIENTGQSRQLRKIKKQIEYKLDQDPYLRESRKLNIIDEILQLKKSTLPSKEITELQKTTSTLKEDIVRLTTLLEYDTSTKFLENMNKKILQSEKLIDHLLEENEYHKSEMSTTQTTILQLQQDIKLLFVKTVELQYENTRLKQLIYL